MFASASTSDGQWFAVRIRPNGHIQAVIPGLYKSRIASDEYARRFLGLKR